MFKSNNYSLFYLRKENLVKHQKVSKYYEGDYSVSNTYFIKARTFRERMNKLLENTKFLKKMKILDVICTRFYLWGIGRGSNPVRKAGDLSTKDKRSTCLSVVCSR